MFTKFGVRNYFSFEEGIEVSFDVTNAPKDSVPNVGGLTTVLGIKGANGSGKTNIIRAISMYRNFAGISNEINKEGEFDVETFFSSKKPSEFYYEFIIGNATYCHEFAIQGGHITFERITRTIKRKTELLVRKNNQIESCLSTFEELKSIKLNSKASIATITRTHKFKGDFSELNKINHFATKVYTNVNFFGYMDFELDKNSVSKDYLLNEQYKSAALNILQKADSGIINFEILSNKGEKGETNYFPVFHRKNKGKVKKTLFYQESKGNQRLFKVIHLYTWILSIGGVLALDEFDIHLHAKILPEILKLFEDLSSNNHSAQFIFTAHNTEIIDSLGKYRTVLVNKEDNESYCYRLDEIPGSIVRNDRAISPLYLAGKIGGIPTNTSENGSVS